MKTYAVLLTLLIMSTFAKADDLANLSIQKYRQLRETAPEMLDVYMSGLAIAYTLSNTMLERNKQSKIYCVPPDLVIGGKNLQNLIDPMVAKDLEIKGANTTSVAGLALATLVSVFPCK